MSDAPHNTITHEPDDTDIRAVGLTGVALGIGVAIILVLVYGIFQYLLVHRVIISPANPLSETEQQQYPPLPRIEQHPAKELTDLHSREDYILSTYGWMDKKAGVVRIPIDEAIQLQLTRGFPVRKEGVTK